MMTVNKILHNKKLFFLLLCLINFACVLPFKNSQNRIFKSQNTNNYSRNNNNYYPNSRIYNNPYQYPSYYGYQGVQDYDQFYIAPRQFNNIEPESKSVILNKY